MSFPQEVEHLIFRGFLTVKLKISGVDIALKTINDNENDLISQLTSSSREKSFYVLAFSVFLFEKENILIEPRLEKIEMLVNFFKKLRTHILSKLFKAIIALNKKATDSLIEVQRFVYDPLSRMRWHSVKNIPINSPQYTGIVGTENLGLNMHQQIWYALNTTSDLGEYSEIAWDLLKVVLKTQMSKKDFSRFDARDKKRKEDVKKKRQEIFEGRGPDLRDRDTREGLVHELKQAVSGKRDEHDNFIADYERQLKERALLKDLALKQLRESKYQEEDLPDVTVNQRAATSQEVEQLFSPKSKQLPEKKTIPVGRDRFSQQMAELSENRREELIKEVEKRSTELNTDLSNSENPTDPESDFFIDSQTSIISEEDLNNKLLTVKPGTLEYKKLVAEIRKMHAWKL